MLVVQSCRPKRFNGLMKPVPLRQDLVPADEDGGNGNFVERPPAGHCAIGKSRNQQRYDLVRDLAGPRM